MKERHALWDALAQGWQTQPRTSAQREALYRFNLVVLAENFGWSPSTIESLPLDLYDDILIITGLINHHRNKQK